MIAALRKFGNFLIGLFPVIGAVADWIGARIRQLASVPIVARCVDRLRENRKAAAIGSLVERFFWRDYGKDRLDLSVLPAESLHVIRPVFLVTVLLTVSMPFAAVFHTAGPAITTASGAVTQAPLWAIWLWSLVAGLAWGCVVAGAMRCNRAMFVAASLVYVYLLGACAFFLPRSLWNGLVPACAVMSVALAERALHASGARSRLPSVATALAVGAPAGVYLAALTPLHSMVKPHVVLLGGLLGGALCLLSMIWGGRAWERNQWQAASSMQLPAALAVYAITAGSAAFLVSLLLRGGPGAYAEQLLSVLTLWNGYLWPVWYFIGVGIIFKLLKSTKIVSSALRDLLPERVFVPAVLFVITAGACLTWSETVVASASAAGMPAVLTFFAWVYKNSQWFWSNPVSAFSAQWMRWILLCSIVAGAWLGSKRRLTGDTAASLLYWIVLSWFLISEYLFQFLSFGRSQAHSVALLTVFAMWLVWLFHTAGLKLSLESSPGWPSAGRLCLYAAVVLFCLLEVNARTILGDFRVMDEMFLIMFRGVVDVGLPYFVYVVASRRFGGLPLRAGKIFQLFCLGALLTFPLNVLDKLALCSWSLGGLREYVVRQVQVFMQSGVTATIPPVLPETWVVMRSVIYVGTLVLIAVLTRRHITDRLSASPATVLALLSFAAGFAAFSRSWFELPLPTDARVLILPMCTTLYVDYNLLASILSAWLPALVLGACVIWKGQYKLPGAFAWVAGAGGAFGINWTLSYAWPAYEAWLRSTGMLEVFAVVAVFLLIALITGLSRRAESDLQRETVSDAI
ncbi:MAG TPA: hypothetical protein V6D08_02690 [Candidatus Obscuribacterales bacterium]